MLFRGFPGRGTGFASYVVSTSPVCTTELYGPKFEARNG